MGDFPRSPPAAGRCRPGLLGFMDLLSYPPSSWCPPSVGHGAGIMTGLAAQTIIQDLDEVPWVDQNVAIRTTAFIHSPHYQSVTLPPLKPMGGLIFCLRSDLN